MRLLDIVAVENAMFRLAHDPEVSVNSEIRKQVVYAMATNDAGDCDADVAGRNRAGRRVRRDRLRLTPMRYWKERS